MENTIDFISFILVIIVIVQYEIRLWKLRETIKQLKQHKAHFYVTRNRSNNELSLWLGKPFKGTQNWIERAKTTLLATSENFYEYDLKVEDLTIYYGHISMLKVFLNLED